MMKKQAYQKDNHTMIYVSLANHEELEVKLKHF